MRYLTIQLFLFFCTVYGQSFDNARIRASEAQKKSGTPTNAAKVK